MKENCSKKLFQSLTNIADNSILFEEYGKGKQRIAAAQAVAFYYRNK